MMKKFFTILVISTVCLFTVNLSEAQKKRYPVHELSASVSGGFSSLLYKVEGGKHSGGVGGNIEIGYTYNIKRYLGIMTGLGVSLCTSKFTAGALTENYVGDDELYEGYTYTLTYSLTGGYSERHRFALFTIPVMARYLGGSRSIKHYVAGGLKFGIPAGARATISPGMITTEGFYEFEAATYRDLPRHGFPTDRPVDEVDYNLKLGIVTLFALEAGFRFPAGYKKDLQVGVYLDCSPFDARSTSNRHVVEFQPASPQFFEFNSVLNTATAGKLSLINTGVKIGISF
jgi:hypothetical protein